MMNKFAKGLVLLHTTLSVAGMIWASSVILNVRDFGWKEPAREVVERTKDGTEKTAVRYASEYDKSVAAVVEAAGTRDLAYIEIKPAVESLRETEPYLVNNHLFYMAELKRIRESPDKIEVKRFKNTGLELDTPNDLGKSVFEDAAVEGITKSKKYLEQDLDKINGEIAEVQKDIRKIVAATAKFTEELTGTNEVNKYIQPGLYQLVDLEFQTQAQIVNEIDNIKPAWSKAVEQARLFRFRFDDLKKTEKIQLEFLANKANKQKK